jgi:hypothetical protein
MVVAVVWIRVRASSPPFPFLSFHLPPPSHRLPSSLSLFPSTSYPNPNTRPTPYTHYTGSSHLKRKEARPPHRVDRRGWGAARGAPGEVRSSKAREGFVCACTEEEEEGPAPSGAYVMSMGMGWDERQIQCQAALTKSSYSGPDGA